MNMKMNDNTILVTGGGSGIGLELAKAFHARGNQVIIAGRRKEILEQAVAGTPGMHSMELDIQDASAINTLAAYMEGDFPALNVVIHAAGIMRAEQIVDGKLADAEATIATNLLGPIRLTAALMPLLQRQADATIMTVSSGLAFVPLVAAPTYCATKAAIHSYTQSLRVQLKGTPVKVMELIPPYVQTELMFPGQATDPHAMPLREFIDEVMRIIEGSPDAHEICVERVMPQRTAEASGEYDVFFTRVNSGFTTTS
jgi:uncharacterized oxidoreductase